MAERVQGQNPSGKHIARTVREALTQAGYVASARPGVAEWREAIEARRAVRLDVVPGGCFLTMPGCEQPTDEVRAIVEAVPYRTVVVREGMYRVG